MTKSICIQRLEELNTDLAIALLEFEQCQKKISKDDYFNDPNYLYGLSLKSRIKSLRKIIKLNNNLLNASQA
jgi:hypothetical protein